MWRYVVVPSGVVAGYDVSVLAVVRDDPMTMNRVLAGVWLRRAGVMRLKDRVIQLLRKGRCRSIQASQVVVQSRQAPAIGRSRHAALQPGQESRPGGLIGSEL